MGLPSLIWKVVYWGPEGSGKTTCLQVLERRAPRARGGLATIAAQPDHGGCRFELLPLEFAHQGRPAARMDVFTVPGCPACVAMRGLILQRADAVVFVADPEPSRLQANRQAASELMAALRAQGRDPARVPVLVQINKRELPQALPTARLLEALRPLGPTHEVVSSVATLGEGVTAGLRLLMKALLRQAAAPAAPAEGREPAAALPPAPAAKGAAHGRASAPSEGAASEAAPRIKAGPAKPSVDRAPAARAAPAARKPASSGRAPARAHDRGRSGRAPALAR